MDARIKINKILIMKIEYYKKNVYGVENIYIHPSNISVAVRALTHKKTVNDEDLKALAALGHEIIHKPIN